MTERQVFTCEKPWKFLINLISMSQLLHPTVSLETLKLSSSPSKIPNNKHIIPADSICVNKQLGTGEFGIVQQGVWTNGTERVRAIRKLNIIAFSIPLILLDSSSNQVFVS